MGECSKDTDRRGRGTSLSRALGMDGAYRAPCEWSSVTCVLETEGLGQKGRLEPESLTPRWILLILCSFSLQNHQRFFLSRGWHDDWLSFLINKRRMHIYYILSQAKQIVWDGCLCGSSFEKHSYGAEVGAGTWRGQEICDLVLVSQLTTSSVNDPSKYWVPLPLLWSEIRLMISLNGPSNSNILSVLNAENSPKLVTGTLDYL